MYPTGHDGKRHLSKAGRQYRENVYGEVLDQLGIFRPLKDPLFVTLGIYPPDRRKRDVDNMIKAVFDALVYSNVFIDDDQVVGLTAYKLPSFKPGSCVVSIQQAQAWYTSNGYASLEDAYLAA